MPVRSINNKYDGVKASQGNCNEFENYTTIEKCCGMGCSQTVCDIRTGYIEIFHVI